MGKPLHIFPGMRTSVIYGSSLIAPWDINPTHADLSLAIVPKRYHTDEFLRDSSAEADILILALQHMCHDELVKVTKKATTIARQGIISVIPPDKMLMAKYVKLECNVFCSQEDDSSEFQRALEWLTLGKKGIYLSPLLSLQIVVAQEYVQELQLSRAEMRVLELSLHSNKFIAKQLHLSEGTVRNYITKLIQKIGEPDRKRLLETFYRKLYERASKIKIQNKNEKENVDIA